MILSFKLLSSSEQFFRMIKEESWTKDQGTQGHTLEQNAGVILGEMGDERSQKDQGQVENLPEVDAFTEVRTKDSRIQGHPMEPNVKDVVWGEMGDKSDQGGVQGHVEETSDENKDNRSEQAECLLIARQHPKAEGIYLEGSCEDIKHVVHCRHRSGKVNYFKKDF